MREGEATGAAGAGGGAPGAPPLGLLRLREAGVVRLCGLSAASRGLDLAARRALSQPRRDGAHLSALVGTDEPVAAWFEVIATELALEDLTLAAVRWGCATHTLGAGVTAGTAGCEHIAAILSAWVRAPGDFRAPAAPERPHAPPAVPALPHPTAPEPTSATIPSTSAGQRQPATLADELRRLPERDLRALARRTLGGGEATSDGMLEGLLTALAAALRDPDALTRLLAELDAESRETLAWTRLAGGALTAAGLEALAVRSCRPVSALRGALAALERHGLLFSTALPDGAPQPGKLRGRAWQGVAGWRIAPETRAALPRDLPIQPLSRAEIVAERPRVERASPRSLLLALALIPYAPAPLGAPAHEVGSSRPERGGALTPEDLPESALQAAARAAGLDPDAARLARRLLLWSLDDDAERSEPFALGADDAGRLRAYQTAFARWRTVRSPADLLDLERVTGTVRMRYDHTHEAFRPAALADEAAAARGWVTRLLGLAAPGSWYLVGDLIELVWRVNPYFLRGKQLAWRTPVWRLERVADGRPLHPTVREEWQAAEGAYLRALFMGPLRLWGALDLTLDGAGSPRLFRLTPLGVALLARQVNAATEMAAARALAFDSGPAATLTKDGALAVQPLAASPALLTALDQWAEVTALAGGRLLYTFTPARALACFDDGLGVERALGPLRAAGLARAAQTLAPKLEGWRQGYGDTRLTDGLVIVEGRDEATLREALASTQGLADRVRRIGPAVAALAPEDAAVLRAALTKKGWEL
jgi:hypothetical protein